MEGQRKWERRYSRLSVVLLPLSLWPRRSILTSCFIRNSFLSCLSISSMPSLTRFASSSAKSLRSRSAGDSFWGGWSAAQKGSDMDLRRFGTSGTFIIVMEGRGWARGGRGEGGRARRSRVRCGRQGEEEVVGREAFPNWAFIDSRASVSLVLEQIFNLNVLASPEGGEGGFVGRLLFAACILPRTHSGYQYILFFLCS